MPVAGPDRVEFTLWGDRMSHRLHDWFWLKSSDGGPWTVEFPAIQHNTALQIVADYRLRGALVWRF